MEHRSLDGMRRYWDDAAHRNAAWYVDTSLSYDDPDMERFWETGRTIVAEATGPDAPAHAQGHRLAVEIGSGLGRNCKALRETYDEVVGVDISPEMVRRSGELVPACRFVLGDGATLPGVADGSADAVLSFTVFQHIPDPAVIEAYVVEAGRVLAPGGVFVFQWNNSPGAGRWVWRRRLRTLVGRLGRGDAYGRDAAQFLGSIVPLPAMQEALGRAGLRLVETRGEGTLFCWAWAVRAQ